MRKALRIALIVVLVPVSLALMVGIVFAVDRATNGGEVLGQVSVADRQLGGLDGEAARAELRSIEDELAAIPIRAKVDGMSFEIQLGAIGFDVDEEAMLEIAMAHGRDGTMQDQFRWWVDQFGEDDGIGLEIPFTYDREAIRSIVEEWAVEAVADPPFEGHLAWIDGAPVIAYPRPGVGLDVDTSVEIIEATLSNPNRTPVELPTTVVDPATNPATLETVAAEATRLATGDIYLVKPGRARIVIPEAVVKAAVDIERSDEGGVTTYSVTWSEAPIARFAAPLIDYLRSEPVEASLTIDDTVQEVIITKSINATAPDLDSIVREARAAVETPARWGWLEFVDVAEPEVTSEDLEEFGVKELIGEFTTYHSCCENRVINIQLIADMVDGAVVLPGETWSLNEHVGRRTIAKGFVRAGAIIGGEVTCCDSDINIGGGTSQFTTTLYNAFFFAGLEDVTHTPHSIWFPRYPEGREATLGFPSPDLAFRNNTDAAVVIRTSHTATSITARIYGDNGGIEVEAGLSQRYNFSGIQERTEVNNEIPPGVEFIKQEGSGGWSVDIFRYITYPDGTETEEQWTWHYSGAFKIIEINQCMLDDPPCPPEGDGDE